MLGRLASGSVVSRLLLAVAGAAVVLPLSAAASAPAVSAGDTPPGFWYGTDSRQMPVTGTGPYIEPVIGGNYGGDGGMAGDWAAWAGGHRPPVWSAANFSQAAANFSKYHKGVGTAAYWFMAGPGVDPAYDGTVAEATAWGQQQAARALADIHGTENYPVVWMDVELPGDAPTYTPAPDNGWNNVYTSACSGVVAHQHIDPAVDRGVLDGFASYLTAHSSYKPGVDSSRSVWGAIFGTVRPSQLRGSY